VGNDHPVALRRQDWDDIGVAVDVVGPAMEQNHRRAVGGAGLDVAEVEDARIDLLDGAERAV
jgi:hypothetical protein